MSPNETVQINVNFFSQIGIPVYIKDLNNQLIFCNNSFLELAQLPKECKIVGGPQFGQYLQNRLKDVVDFSGITDTEMIESSTYLSTLRVGTNKTIKVRLYQSAIYSRSNDLIGHMGVVERRGEELRISGNAAGVLSPRQIEILNLLVTGKSVKSIANLLMVSPHTVTDHVKSIYSKLGVHSRAEAIYKITAKQDGD